MTRQNGQNGRNKRRKKDISSEIGDISNLSTILDQISKDENLVEQAISVIMDNQIFKNAISEKLSSELSSLHLKITQLE